MQAWSTVYSPKEISYLASYVKSLHGTNPPNPKAPQGDLYTETAASDSQAGSASDSATTNTTKVKDTIPAVTTPN